MTVANTKALEYLGKYVSFQCDSTYLHVGVVNSVVFSLNGNVEFSIGWDDYYDFSKVTKLEILGEVTLIES
jgi:hypothetical protein